ncbi:MAG: hypothetical protein AAGA85_00160 [Bacteroidota bacterium]
MKYGFLVLLCCVACTQIPDCSLDPNADVFFVSFSDDEVNSFTFTSITNDLITTDYAPDSAILAIALPLTETSAVITYRFETDTLEYSLTVGYRSQLNIYGDDCPASVQFLDVEVINYANFDTAFVTNPILTSRIEENIEVLF